MPPGGHSAWSLAATFTTSPWTSSAIWNDIADVDADAEADRLIGREVAIMGGHLLLHLHRATHCSVNALENDKQ